MSGVGFVDSVGIESPGLKPPHVVGSVKAQGARIMLVFIATARILANAFQRCCLIVPGFLWLTAFG